MLRFLTAGESHGPGLVTIVEGLPAGLVVSAERLSTELARRRMGAGRGRRMALERDELEILGGVRFGRTLGGPVAVVVRNTEWPKWQDEMSPEPGAASRPLTTPRPGHADLPGMLKYDTRDARDILERSSARETAARTIAGTLAKIYLEEVDVTVLSHVIAIGSARVAAPSVPASGSLDLIDSSPVRCLDAETETEMLAEIASAHEERDTLGGLIEVVVHGLPAGLGSHVHWDRKLDGLLAAAVMSIPSVKGVEIGDAASVSAVRGSVAHDEISHDRSGFSRLSNRAGGLEGGMTNGEPLIVRAAMKPISTLMRPLRSVDVTTKEETEAFRERSDVFAVPAGGVVAEQMVAFVLADEFSRMFGGDTVDELQLRVGDYRARLRPILMDRPLWLVGMMGAGKSTVAPLVAAALDADWVDTDRVIEEVAGTSVEALFAESEAAFRALEVDVIRSLCGGPCVVATGGGAVTTAAADIIADSGLVVWLRATAETLMSRVGDGSDRPLLAGGTDAVVRISAERSPSYERVADVVIDTDDLGPDEVREKGGDGMAQRLVAGVTEVTVGRDVARSVIDGTESTVVLLSQPGAVATTATVEEAVVGHGIPLVSRVLADGEGAKALSVVESVAGWMADSGVNRDATLIAVGGGALTDAAGFIASVFMRGIEARYVPTTLLGAIDASIGGKTAVNVGGKNLVGTFAHPSRVVIDIDVLERLPTHLIADGMAEALKAGCIGDERLVAVLEQPDPDLGEVVARSIAVKAAVVEQDFTEQGVRAHLNFGHTVGRTVEVLAGWSHGRSVAVGMVAASEISARVFGFTDSDRLVDAVRGLGLPVRVDGLDRPDVHSLMLVDKKGDSTGLRMVLLEGLTRPVVSHVDTATLEFGLDAIGIGEK